MKKNNHFVNKELKQASGVNNYRTHNAKFKIDVGGVSSSTYGNYVLGSP